MAWGPSGGRLIPLRVTIIYTIVGLIWISPSDAFLAVLFSGPATLTRLQTLKGFLFIFVTASALYLIISRDAGVIQRSEKALIESEAKYRSLVETINDWVWEGR